MTSIDTASDFVHNIIYARKCSEEEQLWKTILQKETLEK